MARLLFLLLAILLIGVWLLGRLAFHATGFINALLFVAVLALMAHFATSRFKV